MNPNDSMVRFFKNVGRESFGTDQIVTGFPVGVLASAPGMVCASKPEALELIPRKEEMNSVFVKQGAFEKRIECKVER